MTSTIDLLLLVVKKPCPISGCPSVVCKLGQYGAKQGVVLPLNKTSKHRVYRL